jgi:hypothetical protein
MQIGRPLAGPAVHDQLLFQLQGLCDDGFATAWLE